MTPPILRYVLARYSQETFRVQHFNLQQVEDATVL